jgi:hypothetical protein
MLKLNVGLTKKVGEANYGSRGASVNLELELDSSLVEDSDRLKGKIRQLFGLARTAVSEELNGNGTPPSPESKPAAPPNGDTNGQTNQRSGKRQATQSQIKAIHAIARSRRINLGTFLTERFHVRLPEDLDIKTASQVIDELKADNGRSA